jgi:hypothetical protein
MFDLVRGDMLTNVKESHDECVENVGDAVRSSVNLTSSGAVIGVAMVNRLIDIVKNGAVQLSDMVKFGGVQSLDRVKS